MVAANASIAAQPGNPEPVVDRAFAQLKAGRYVLRSNASKAHTIAPDSESVHTSLIIVHSKHHVEVHTCTYFPPAKLNSTMPSLARLCLYVCDYDYRVHFPPLLRFRLRYMSAQSDYELARSMGDSSQETALMYALSLGQHAIHLDQTGNLQAADA